MQLIKKSELEAKKAEAKEAFEKREERRQEVKEQDHIFRGYAPKYKVDQKVFTKTEDEKIQLKQLKKAWKANQSI